jgi:hypothetical protein
MNDPHVDRLRYSIGHSEGRDYTAARPQEDVTCQREPTPGPRFRRF